MSAKISPVSIIRAHLATMRDDARESVSVADCLVFFGVPILVCVLISFSNERLTNEVFNGSASVFGIFVGLLLNVQVAIFGIFLRKPEKSPDPAAQQVFDVQTSRRARVLRELNANIAYLILVCSLAIALCLLFLGLSSNFSLFTGLIAGLYVHVLLNLVMTVKRAFLLFDAEYQRP